MKKYLSKNLWVIKRKNSNTLTIGFNNMVLCKRALKYTLFENKILAINFYGDIYVYFIYATGNQNKIKLVRILSKNDNLEVLRVVYDEYSYIINFDCKVICQGRV